MEIKFCDRINGKGLFAKEKYTKRELIFTLDGPIKNEPDKYSIEIGVDQHITDKYGVYMNHSFKPTTKILGKKVIALTNINIGDELNFNYNDNESNMASPFDTDEGYVGGKS